MRRDLYYKKEVRREFENFGNLCSTATVAYKQMFATINGGHYPQQVELGGEAG